jgi:hypothetical protein
LTIEMDYDGGDAALVIRGNGRVAMYSTNMDTYPDEIAPASVGQIAILAFLVSAQHPRCNPILRELARLVNESGSDA